MRAAALLVLAACSAPAPSAPLTSRTAPRPAPATPPPSVTFASMQLAATGLPAIAADGSLVIHTLIDGDGGRGNPNLTLVIKDRTDHEVDKLVVITANESEGQFDDRGASPMLTAKLDAANRWLADLHARSDLRPLTTGGLVVELAGARLTIRARGALVVDTATPASWFIPDKQICTSCAEVCRHPLFLGAAHGDLAHDLVLLTISYAGTDLCPEPVSQHHVITW